LVSLEPGSDKKERIGILGGTFDPIHLGHLVLAEETRTALGLDRVIFVPAAQPWRKVGRAISDAGDRLAMVRLAIASNPCFTVSTIELERRGPTYTVETLRQMRAAAPNALLWFILGSDALLDLPNWKAPDEILSQARLAVATRQGAELERLDELQGLLPELRRQLDLVPMPRVSISSSDLRRRLRAGVSTRYLLPDDIVRYATEHGLYQASDMEDRVAG
jgi:nicotinate-nucleotide adenylyltransferase